MIITLFCYFYIDLLLKLNNIRRFKIYFDSNHFSAKIPANHYENDGFLLVVKLS